MLKMPINDFQSPGSLKQKIIHNVMKQIKDYMINQLVK